MSREALHFIVESGTDVRLVQGLAERFDLHVFARRIVGGVEVSQPPAGTAAVDLGPASRVSFWAAVLKRLLRASLPRQRVLVQGYGLAAVAANLAGRFTGTPTFMLVCSPAERYYLCRRHHRMPGKPFRRCELVLLRAVAGLNARIGQAYFVLSRHLEEVVRGHGTRRPVHIVPVYGVDTDVFRPPTAPRVALRRRRALPDNGALIFFGSRVAPEKDAETALEAIKQLLAAGRDVWLLHRSGGYRTLLALAREHGLAQRVVASDAVHPERDLPLDYQASDVFVQASREEGLGFSAIEALACETPVVATGVGGLRETIIDGETGWTYPVGDACALADRIRQALDDPAEAARRAAAGRRLVMERYERRLVFDQLTRLLQGL